MNSDRDGQRSGGVQIDGPFFSIRMGGGWMGQAAGDDSVYEQARRRVRSRLGLYRHAATFVAIIGAIAFIDLVTDGELSDWVLWFGAIWGALLIWHAFTIFIFPALWSPETEQRMIAEEMRRQGGETSHERRQDPG